MSVNDQPKWTKEQREDRYNARYRDWMPLLIVTLVEYEDQHQVLSHDWMTYSPTELQHYVVEYRGPVHNSLRFILVLSGLQMAYGMIQEARDSSFWVFCIRGMFPILALGYLAGYLEICQPVIVIYHVLELGSAYSQIMIYMILIRPGRFTLYQKELCMRVEMGVWFIVGIVCQGTVIKEYSVPTLIHLYFTTGMSLEFCLLVLLQSILVLLTIRFAKRRVASFLKAKFN